LLSDASGADRARLLASRSPGSGSLIHALPSANLGLLLPDRVVRVAVGLRFGAKIVSRHICVCGLQVNPDGLSCRRNAGRQSCHHAVNEFLARSLRSIDMPAVLEPPGLMNPGDGKRPDGMTLVPWSAGRSLV